MALNTLLQALLGGAAGGFKGYAEGQYAKQAQEERDEERRLAKEQQDRLYRLSVDTANAAKTDRERGYAKEAWMMATPEEDLTHNPMLPDMERFGFGVKKTPGTPAPKFDSFTLPQMPSYGFPSLSGSAPSTPMTEGKYDPTAEAPEAATPPAMSALTVNTPSYGMGTPGKITRQKTQKETMEGVVMDHLQKTIADPQTPAHIRSQYEQTLARMGGITMPTPAALREGPVSGGKQSLYDPVSGEVLNTLDATPDPVKFDLESAIAAKRVTGKDITSLSELTPDQIAAAQKLVAGQKIAGTRAPQGSGAPSLSTTNVPQDYQIVAGRVMGGRPAHARVAAQNTIQQLWESGDTQGLNSYIRQLAVESEPSTIKERITSRIETVDALRDASALLRELKTAGVDTNIMAGGAERMVQYLGSTNDPRLAALGTQLATILMNYRRGITGAAFSASEAGEYAKIWPSISNNLALNEAQIDGLVRTLQGADVSYWKRKLGDKGAELVGAVPAGGSTTAGAKPKRTVDKDGNVTWGGNE